MSDNILDKLWPREHAAAQMDAAVERGDFAAAKIHAAKVIPIVIGSADLRGNGTEPLAREHKGVELLTGQPLTAPDFVPNELDITGDVTGRILNISAVFVPGSETHTGTRPPTYTIKGDITLNATVGATDTLPAMITIEVLGHVNEDGQTTEVTGARSVDVVGRIRAGIAAGVAAALKARESAPRVASATAPTVRTDDNDSDDLGPSFRVLGLTPQAVKAARLARAASRTR